MASCSTSSRPSAISRLLYASHTTAHCALTLKRKARFRSVQPSTRALRTCLLVAASCRMICLRQSQRRRNQVCQVCQLVLVRSDFTAHVAHPRCYLASLRSEGSHKNATQKLNCRESSSHPTSVCSGDFSAKRVSARRKFKGMGSSRETRRK